MLTVKNAIVGTVAKMQDPLAQLRDIHLPEPVAWWPLAFGWWVLIGLLAVALLLLSRHLILRYQSKLYRRQALVKLSLIKRDSGKNGVEKLIATFLLLRQVSKSAYTENQCSNLEISEFIPFLQANCPDPVFTDLPDNIQTILYSQSTSDMMPIDKLQSIFESCETWINKHTEGNPSSW